MKRTDKDKVYMIMARILGERSTCIDKQVGCIITNKQNEIIASGYNGSPRRFVHCIDLGFCVKESLSNLDKCPSAHAEQNALTQCRVPDQIYTIYVTLSPCISCIRIIMNTPCKRIVFLVEHGHLEAKQMWKGEWINGSI